MEGNQIYSSIIAAMGDIEAIGKNKKNEQQGYKFRGIDDMYNAVHPLFAKHKIFITSKVLNYRREERVTKSGTVMFTTLMDVEFTFFAEDGSSVSSVMRGEAQDSADKGANKAQSAALKYALMQMFLIPTEDIDDPDNTTPQETIPQKETPPPATEKSIDYDVKAIIRTMYEFKIEKEYDLFIKRINEKYKIQPSDAIELKTVHNEIKAAFKKQSEVA